MLSNETSVKFPSSLRSNVKVTWVLRYYRFYHTQVFSYLLIFAICMFQDRILNVFMIDDQYCSDLSTGQVDV